MKCVFIALAVLIASPLAARASVFVYRGNPFTTASGALTTADSVVGVVVIDGPPAANSVIVIGLNDSFFSFTAGGVTVTSNDFVLDSTVTFDSNAQVDTWDFQAINAAGDVIRTFHLSGGAFGSSDVASTVVGDHAENVDDPGRWTLVPEANSLAVWAVIGAIVIVIGRRHDDAKAQGTQAVTNRAFEADATSPDDVIDDD